MNYFWRGGGGIATASSRDVEGGKHSRQASGSRFRLVHILWFDADERFGGGVGFMGRARDVKMGLIACGLTLSTGQPARWSSREHSAVALTCRSRDSWQSSSRLS